MSWIVASVLSALVLGLYELCKKHAVDGNAVMPVLFLSTLCGALLWGAVMLVQAIKPDLLPAALWVEPLTLRQHGMLLLKSLIVGGSWVASYFALKHLPVSLASPIRATGPLWTLAGALVLLGERPNIYQGIGVAITLTSFVGLSFVGRSEGIHFHRDKWVGIMVIATLLGAVSGLYDKFLLGSVHFAVSTVQGWFSLYLAVIFLPLAIGWKLRWWPRGEFHWRWSIPLITATLLLADFIYFGALQNPAALVSVVSSIRRGSTLVAFAGGMLLFREQNGPKKLPAVIGVLIGIALTMVG